MAEFGWSYISCGDVLTGSGGPEGAVQFKTPGGVDGSAAFIYDTGSNRVGIGLDWPNLDGKTIPNAALHVNGDVSVTGTIYATAYQIENITSLSASGDSKFGDDSGDTHEFTGSVKINGTLAATGITTLSGDLTASAGILIPDSDVGGVSNPTSTGVGLHVGTGDDLTLYHDGTDSYIYNKTGDLTIASTVNSAQSIRLWANGGTAESIKIHTDQSTAANAITLATDAGGILLNLDATSGKKVHADVESTDADAIHLDSEGGIKLESDTHPVNITGDLTVSGSSIFGTANTDVMSLVNRVTASGGILISDAGDQAHTLQIGTGGDLYLAHDGTDSIITNGTGKFKIQSSVNASEAIRIRANGGTDETIFIRADQGTSVMTDGNSDASVQLKSDAGGIGVRSTANLAGSIQIEADGGTSETIIIKADQSTVDGAAAAGAIQLLSDAGGIGLSWADGKDLWAEGGRAVVTANENAADCIKLHADAGTSQTITIVNDAGTSATEGSAAIQLLSSAGGVNIKSGLNGANAILLTADGGTSETIKVHADQGTAGNSIWLKSDAGGINIEAGATISGSAAGINLTSTQNDVDSIYIRANGGTSEVIKIHSDQGTSATEGAASVQLTSDVGGINLLSGLNGVGSIRLTADGGTDETIVIHSDQGTGEGNGNASIELVSDAGGICFTATGLTGVMTDGNSDAAIQAHAPAGGIGLRSTANLEGCIQIEADGGANETISIHSDQGTGVNTAGNSTDASINLISDAGGIGLYSAINAVNSITIEANGGTSENIRIHSNQGTSATEGAASIQLLSDAGGINIKSGLDGAGAILLTADGGTSETIVVHSDQGTGADSIHLLSDAGGIKLQVGSSKLITVQGGHLVPAADNTLDLGGASNRWRNIYTGDLHLKNDRGDWTIVEESDYLSLRNNNTGKLYKLAMEEISEE